MAFILPPLSKQPKFTAKQLERLASIFDNAGQVFLGILVLSPFIDSVDEQSIFVLILGVSLTSTFWALSLFFTKRSEQKHA